MNSLSKSLSTLDRETIWHGSHGENNRQIALRAGMLSMIYENGNIRYLSAGKNELIRMIYSAVRDKDWLTIDPVISGEKLNIKSDSFKIEYECLYRSGDIDFSATYRIEGHSDSSLTFSFEGVALKTFEKSRIGFCILHPVEGCAGYPCSITHSNGNSEAITFPVFISPVEIFTDIRAMRWNPSGLECELKFTGDIFETEDQRNWTDASYKTYCTPGSLPCPVTIATGEKISQKVEFILKGKVAHEAIEDDRNNIVIDRHRTFAMPHIGIVRSTRQFALTENETGILRALSFDHYRADLYLFNPDWIRQADMAVREAVSLNYSLELALFFDNDFFAQINEFAAWLTHSRPEISIISLFHKSEAVTSDQLINAASPILKRILPGIRIGCGTNANFAQLNGKVPQSTFTDIICYSVHPQEHASDNTTMVENLAGQAFTAISAREFAGEKGIWISSVNLQRRFNANVENYENPLEERMIPPQVDSRIMTLFGACWTAGSIKYLGESGVKGITFYETAGERGIIQGDHDSRWPEHFKAFKGMIFPVYHLFRWLLKDKSFSLILSTSSHPLEVDSLALSDGSRLKLILMNFTSEKQKVMVKGFSGNIKIRELNDRTFADAASDPDWIEKNWESRVMEPGERVLDPYSLTFIEGILL